jgi:hypothetical protein
MSALRSARKMIRLLMASAFFVAVVFTAAGAYGAGVNFGFESVGAEETTAVAGLHPDMTTSFVLNHQEIEGAPKSSGRVEEVSVALPPGLVGDPTAFPRCSTGDFNALGNCPTASQVGIVKTHPSELPEALEPLYNLQPPNRNVIARFGFYAVIYPIYIDVSVRTGSDYGVTATVHDASGQAALISAATTLWGIPADPSHDEQRLTTLEALFCNTACLAPEGRRPSGLTPPKPFLSNPTACEEQEVGFTAMTYQLPGQVFTAQAPLPPTTKCANLSFQPSLQIEPASHQAGAPTGLSAILRIPQNDAVSLPATSAMRAAKVTLPEGMTIASGAADGLEACSNEQVALGKEVDSTCPDASKLGTATFVSPPLPEAIHGAIYQRTPEPGHLFRIWLVTDEFGLHLKLPGEIKADPQTGQLTAEFKETPQLPVEEVDLEFKGGAGAPLKNPDACDAYSADYEFTPWSGNLPVTGKTQPIAINQGCGRGGFSPKLKAGAANPVAGSFSPLIVNLRREDGEENVGSMEVTLPKGELAKLKGVPLCPDAAAATGACPANSTIGSIAVSSGPGTRPLWIPQPGKAPTAIYLSGPYKGAPYSIVTVVPAQAGPFDLGTVVVRGGIYVNPNTAQATVAIDPLPQILKGVPVLYRTIHASIDRGKFALAPTNCEEMKVTSVVTSVHGAVTNPSDRFQVGECAALRFGPTLKLKLKGGTQRGDHPALTATLKTHRDEANINKVSVALPHSEFLAQEHIDTICTRAQFAVGNCPAGSVYGHAQAITSLLDKPLEGPVYLRSSNHPLPDLVVALHGQLDINLSGRIDSVNGGIRTTFSGVPDAPVTKFVLHMRGGKKSLLVNSTDICRSRHRAAVKMEGQNGKTHDPHPLLVSGCGRGK